MTQQTKDDVDVVVVGAGVAGLAAARRLVEAGATVVVLEVVRLTLLFIEPFWESRRFDRRSGGRSLARLSFVHTTSHDVTVFWTCAPVRSRTLVAWSGGSKCTLGAYCYAAVGGSTAAARLARPVDDTLFFAGEAADVEGRTGTVHGAIGTGYRAAAAVLRLTLGRNHSSRG